MVLLKLLYLTVALNLFLTILVCFRAHYSHYVTTRTPTRKRKVEAAVKAAKHLLKTIARNHEDQYLADLELRNTPRKDVKVNPSQIIFGRQTRSIIPKLIKYSSLHAMNFAKRRKRQNHSENSMTKQQKICLLLALEIKYIFYHRKGKNDPKVKLSRRLFHILKKPLCKRKNVQKKPSSHTEKFGTDIE